MRCISHGILGVFILTLLLSFVMACIPSVDALSSEDAQIFSSLGYDLYKQARFNESREAFEKAIALDPYAESSWYGKGIACFGEKNYECAIQALERAISLSPKDERAWMKKGDVFTAMGRKDLALDAYKRVVLLNPNNREAKNNIDSISAALTTRSTTTFATVATTAIINNSSTIAKTTPIPIPSNSSPPNIPMEVVYLGAIAVLIAGVLVALWIFKGRIKEFFLGRSGANVTPEKSPEPSPVKIPAGVEKRPGSDHPTTPMIGTTRIKEAGSPWKIPPLKIPSQKVIGILVLAGIIIVVVALTIFTFGSGNAGGSETGSHAVAKTPSPSPTLSSSSLSPLPQHLREYRDDAHYFSIKIPDTWTVSVSDAIVASDKTDGGVTKVRIQPIHLSGGYRSVTATQIANYVVGKDKKDLSQFTVDRVLASGDGKILEIGASFVSNGVSRYREYMIFVNTPYAMVSSYETTGNLFAEKEDLLRSILKSYVQLAPPAPLSQGNSVDTIGPLHQTTQSGGVTILLPTGWATMVLPGCSGLVAADQQSGTRGVVFVNAIHQSAEPLPSGVTPEEYITTYMPKDFSTVGSSISDVKIISYEEGDVSALSNNGAYNVKSMRVSFKSKGVPCIGSFTVGTYQTGISTAVAYFWGIWSKPDSFSTDAPKLLQIFDSIDYSSSSIATCRNTLNTAWAGARKISNTLVQNADQMREENLALYEDRQARNDEFLEKFSDSILDRDRVYNPQTDQVYEVDPNFYTYYDNHREDFRYQDMRELQAGEWLRYTPLDGTLHVQ